MNLAPRITLTDEQREVLTPWSRGRSTPLRLMQRARIVLLAAEHRMNKDIAAELGIMPNTVVRWRGRFADGGLAAIEKDAPRRGRKPRRREAVARQIIETTTPQRPPNATHWSGRPLAAALGVDKSMVWRVRRANRLKPHLARTFKVSNDPGFVEKLIGQCMPRHRHQEFIKFRKLRKSSSVRLDRPGREGPRKSPPRSRSPRKRQTD